MKFNTKISKNLLKKTILFGICLLILDGLWINFFMKWKYINYFKTLKLGMSIDKLAIVIAYIIMIMSYPLLIYNVDFTNGLIKAGSVGLIIFGTYGFTLAGVFPNYDIKFAIIETIWGIILYGLSYIITNKLIN